MEATIIEIGKRDNNINKNNGLVIAHKPKGLQIALFVGAICIPIGLNSVNNIKNNSNQVEHIRYIEAPEIKGQNSVFEMDMLKMNNFKLISQLETYEDNWNGTGAKAFSMGSIRMFNQVVSAVPKQPILSPTGRDSIVMQYENEDSVLFFEVNSERAEKVLIPQGNYDKAVQEIYTEDICNKISNCVVQFYGM